MGKAGPKFSLGKWKKAVKGTGGVKSKIARRLGVLRVCVDRHIRVYEEYGQVYYDEVEEVGDLCEDKLQKHIRKGNVELIKFYAKTKLKHRGYVERSEVTGKDGNSVVSQIVINPAEVPDDVLAAIATANQKKTDKSS